MADADPRIDRTTSVDVTIPTPAPAKVGRTWRKTALMFSVPLVIVLIAAYFWLTAGRFVSTDNAYVRQDRVSVSSDVGGRIVAVTVRENQPVKIGALLFQIDPAPYRIALEQANAAIATARVQVSTLATDSGSGRRRHRQRQGRYRAGRGNL